MCSVSDTNSLNPLDRQRQFLAAVCSLAPHISLLMPFTGSTGSVVHLHGLTGSKKPSVKANLDIYIYMLGVLMQC